MLIQLVLDKYVNVCLKLRKQFTVPLIYIHTIAMVLFVKASSGKSRGDASVFIEFYIVYKKAVLCLQE